MSTWFEHLFGFREAGYEFTQNQFEYDGGTLISRVNGKKFQTGKFYTPSISQLRSKVVSHRAASTIKHEVVGDALLLHADRGREFDLFQVASQFNALEFTSPDITPEHGITRYAHDLTQGPACSIAAAPGTLFRNYFMKVGTQLGQTRHKQLNNLEGINGVLDGGPYWQFKNGYVDSDAESLASLESKIVGYSWDDLVGAIRIAIQENTQVTFADRFSLLNAPHLVNQVFCSAIPCAYSDLQVERWTSLAQISLDAAYEGTLLAAALQRDAGVGSGRVWLTLIGGGAFGNKEDWIYTAIERALKRSINLDLDIRICHYQRLMEPFSKLSL